MEECTMRYAVQLETGTVGFVRCYTHPGVGDSVVVKYKDEAGEVVEETGILVGFVEVLPDCCDWDFC